MTSGNFQFQYDHEHAVCVLAWWNKISFYYEFYNGWIHSCSIEYDCRKAFTTVLLSVKSELLLILILTLMWGVLIFWGIFSTKLWVFYSKTPLLKLLMTCQYDTLHLSMSSLYIWHLSPVIVDTCHLSLLTPVTCTTPWCVTHVNCLLWCLTPVSCQRNLFKSWGV